VEARPLEGDVQADVVVVGAGISGALLAFTLARRGVRVLVLDRREPVHGSTLASTALLQFEIDVSLRELGDRIGRDKARRAWQRSVAAVRALARLVAREGIRCGYAPRRSLYLAGDVYGARAMRLEAEARARDGLSGDFLDRRTLADRFALDRRGAILSSGSAVANPAQLAAGLLRRAARHGARIHSPVEVRDVASGRGGVQLYTATGVTVHARDAVFCTGYELPRALTLAGHAVKSTWAIATRPTGSLPAWLATTVLWEASDPYLDLRTTADGRVIAGGEDAESATLHTSPAMLAQKSQRIVEQVEMLLPEARLTVSHTWAGAFGESPTGLPIIDGLPGLPHCHTINGFGGNGMTYSMIAATVMSARLAGRRDPDADLYRAPR
jgi:glycine/D-amino acid oxidase-like deaminating enzyme